MTTSRPKGGFYIGVTCPGCGGKLELQEDFFILECSHCGSSLRVVMPDTPPAYLIESKRDDGQIRFRVDRYLKEQGRPLTQSGFSIERIYYPYWKVDGLELKMNDVKPPSAVTEGRTTISLLSTQMDYAGVFQSGRIVDAYLGDISQTPNLQSDDLTVNLRPYHSNQMAGPELEGIPYSIGMRTEYVRMIPYTGRENDDRHEYLPVIRPWSEVLAHLNGAKVSQDVEYDEADFLPAKTILQPRGSVVYFPYCLCRNGTQLIIVDGLNGRVVYDAVLRDEADPPTPVDPRIEFGELNVILHRCPNCGVDLPSNQSHVYICRNCHTVVSLDKDNPLDRGVFHAGRKSQAHDPMFPFWVFDVPKKIVARIAKSAIPNRQPEKLAVPAFRISNFKVTRRLTQRMTAAFPDFPVETAEEFDARFRAVDVSLAEAVTIARICLFCESAGGGPKLKPGSVRINAGEAFLYYAPFHAQSYFYIDSIVEAVTFAKNTVTLNVPAGE